MAVCLSFDCPIGLGSRDHQTNNNCHESDEPSSDSVDSLNSSNVEELNNCSEQQLPASTGLMNKNNMDYTSVSEADHCAGVLHC